MVVWQDPNLLVLDEPTNHLDLDMRHALEVALQGYEGALVIVSHDRHLLRNTVENLVLVNGGAVADYEDDLQTYEKWILGKTSENSSSPTGQSGTPSPDKKQRRSAAERRELLRPVRKALDKTERELEQAQAALEAIEAQLTDSALYEDDRNSELAECVRKQGEIKTKLAALEETWLAQQDEFDSLNDE